MWKPGKDVSSLLDLLLYVGHFPCPTKTDTKSISTWVWHTYKCLYPYWPQIWRIRSMLSYSFDGNEMDYDSFQYFSIFYPWVTTQHRYLYQLNIDICIFFNAYIVISSGLDIGGLLYLPLVSESGYDTWVHDHIS